MSRGRQGSSLKRSLKESTKASHKGATKRKITGKSSLNLIMANHRGIDEVLYQFVSSSDFIHDDMDWSVEEFSDISGCDLEELLDELNKAVS